MTEKEALEQLKFISRVDCHVDTKEAFDIIAKMIRESKRLASDNSWLVLTKTEKEFENVDLFEERDKLKAEIEQLKNQIETRIKVAEGNFNIYSKLEIERDNLKLEIEELKSQEHLIKNLNKAIDQREREIVSLRSTCDNLVAENNMLKRRLMKGEKP